MVWEIFERLYGAHWILAGYSCRNFPKLMIEAGNPPDSRFIGVMENDVNPMIFNPEQFNRMADYLARRLINDHEWRKRNYKKFDNYARRYFSAGERLRKLPLGKMSDKELARQVKKIILLQKQVRLLGVTLNGLPLDGRNHLSNKMREELRDYIGDDAKFENSWSFLTQVTRLSLRQLKEIEIAKLAESAGRISKKELENKLRVIYEKYCWLGYMYYGPPTSYSQFEADLSEALCENKNLKLEEQLKTLSKYQMALMDKLKFSDRARHLIQLAQHVLWQKGWRKDVEYHAFYCYEPLFREIARRKGVKDWKTLLYLLPWEIEEFILQGRPAASVLRERRKFSCFVVDRDEARMLVGREAREFYKKLGVDVDYWHLTYVKGMCAYAGMAKGRVRVIHLPKDMEKMKSGDVIVSQATSPDLILAMKKASAIVTNTGGLICHAAIVARELKIPCVVGTGNATLVFKDGDLVEVDATQGVIRKI
jgi:phosphohistidine swiveling domain-containing protein